MHRRSEPTAIRRAQERDIPQLVQLERDAFRRHYAQHRFDARQFRYYIRRPHAIAQVIARGSDILGYVLGLQFSGSRASIARLYSIAVQQQHRGRGFGDDLLELFLRVARARGSRTVYLEVAEPNTPAIRLFERHGFSRLRTLPGYYSTSVDGIRMVRAL